MRADARRNRERIIEAAREVFGPQRADAQIDDVARRAGVGVGTVYRHFPDKHALMGALVRERFELFNARLREAVANEHGKAFEALADALCDNAVSMTDDAATRFALMSGGEPVFAYAAAEAGEFLELARVLVLRAQAEGALRKDFRAEDIPMVMCSVCSTMDTHKPDWDWRRLLDIMLAGMREPTPRP
jgi:AcrR family transcriptional regulator